MKYTDDQKRRMVAKLKAMKNGTIFNLNKKDVCPIKCKLIRFRTSISLVAPELNDDVLLTIQGNSDSNETLMMVVDTIEDWINHWDIVTKQYFIDLARCEGLDP